MEIEAIVAEIDDDGLLGVDILQNGGNGPADLLMSKSVMVFNNKEVPMIQVSITNRVRKVKAADDFVVPAQSDCLIDVNLERQEYNDVSRERNYIAEPTEHFQAEYSLLMASTLADIKEAATCKVRMLNPFPTAILIKQDAVIGKEQPIASKPRVIGNQRDNSEVKTHTTLRRIKPFKEETSQSFSANVTRKAQVDGNTDIPGQQMALCKKSTLGLGNKSERREWTLHLDCLAGARCTTPTASTKMMPYRFIMSREARWPDEIVLGSTEDHGDHVKMSYGNDVDIGKAKKQPSPPQKISSATKLTAYWYVATGSLSGMKYVWIDNNVIFQSWGKIFI